MLIDYGGGSGFDRARNAFDTFPFVSVGSFNGGGELMQLVLDIHQTSLEVRGVVDLSMIVRRRRQIVQLTLCFNCVQLSVASRLHSEEHFLPALKGHVFFRQLLFRHVVALIISPVMLASFQ